MEHQNTVRLSIVRIEDLIKCSGVQQTANILDRYEMGDDVVHFIGWGDFSLAKGHFLPIRVDAVGIVELVGSDKAGSLAV